MLEQGAQLPPSEVGISAEHCWCVCVRPVEEWQAECCEHIRRRLDSCGGLDGRLAEDQGRAVCKIQNDGPRAVEILPRHCVQCVAW